MRRVNEKAPLRDGPLAPAARMRILWLCGSRIVGGAERATVQVASLLHARGYRLDVLHPRGSALASSLATANLPAQPGPLGGAFNVRAFRAIRRSLRAATHDVALVTTPDEWVWACLANDAGSRTRVVLVRHMTLRLAGGVRWLANRRADAVVAVSRAVRDSLVGRRGIRPDLVHVIPNPVRFPIRRQPPSTEERAAARRQLGLDPAACWIGFFGGLRREKGIGDVIRAASDVHRARGSTRLLVCGQRGSAADRAAVTGWLREHRFEERAHFPGEIDRVDLAMTAVDAVAMATASALGEAMPLTLMEAMACGTPTAAYGVGGVAEAIGENGQAGHLVEPDDPGALAHALVKLLADSTAARRVAVNALERARNLFHPDRAADEYERLLLAL